MKKENTLSDQEFLKCQLDPDLLDAAEGSIRIPIWPRKYKAPLWYKKGCQWKDLKSPSELEIKDSYIKLQNNFNYYSHFQDHSNAMKYFTLALFL